MARGVGPDEPLGREPPLPYALSMVPTPSLDSTPLSVSAPDRSADNPTALEDPRPVASASGMAVLASESAVADTVPDALRGAYETVHRGLVVGIDEEIAAVQRDIARWGGDQHVSVRLGLPLESTADEYTYEFHVTGRVFPPPFTRVDIALATRTFQGVVEEVDQTGTTLIVTTEDRLDANGVGAVLSFNATWVLEALRGRLGVIAPEMAHAHFPMVLKVLGLLPTRTAHGIPEHPSHGRRGLEAGQTAAIGQAIASELTLVFGPPGTGKTRTLGGLVAELAITQGRKVVLCAHTNVALDTAMAAVVDAVGEATVAEGSVVRVGRHCKEFRHLRLTPRDLAHRKARGGELDLFAELHTIRQSLDRRQSGAVRSSPSGVRPRKRSAATDPDLMIRELLRRCEELLALGITGAGGELVAIKHRLEALKGARAASGDEHVRGARIVGATLSKLATDMDLFQGADTVIIDEASMAALPFGVVAALVARKAIAIFGDPRQLPPIVQADTPMAKTWLGRDLFRQLGADDPKADDPRRAMLLVQHRMATPIREIVSRLFYANRLEDGVGIRTRPQRMGPAVVLVDTSDTEARAVQSGSSWQNVTHAEIVADLTAALTGLGEPDIGIISPFAPQQRLLKELVEQRVPTFWRQGGFVRTIHRAQGGEQDVIIVDLTSAGKVSPFLDERSRIGTALTQLMCVALSRARHRLIIVAHTASFRQHFGNRGLVITLLSLAARTGHYVRWSDALESRPATWLRG